MTDITLEIPSVFSRSVFSTSYYRTGVSSVTLDRIIEYGLRGSSRHAGRETFYRTPPYWHPHEHVKSPLQYTIVCRGGNALASNLLTLFREHTWVAMDDDGDGQAEWDILLTDWEVDYEPGRNPSRDEWRIRLNFYRRPSRDLKFHMRLNYGQGNIIFDGSKNAWHGTNTGGTWTAEGKHGWGLQFSGGAGNYAILPTNTWSPHDTSEETFCLWVNRQSHYQWTHFLSFYGDNTYRHRIGQSDDANTIIVYFHDGALKNMTYASFQNDTWTHLAFVFIGGDTAYLYINGDEADSASVGATLNGDATGRWYIGARNPSGIAVSAIINDVRVFDRALSASEIEEIYDATA